MHALPGADALSSHRRCRCRLIDPLYEDGVLSTTHGGILTAPDLRIQAQNLTYVKRTNTETPICTVQCEGKLLIDYQEWTLVGDALYYDFAAHKGYLINGRTAAFPWYIGGREFLLMEDGSLVILDGFITTSEGEVQDLVLCSPYICLTPDNILTAKQINIRVNQIPILLASKGCLKSQSSGALSFRDEIWLARLFRILCECALSLYVLERFQCDSAPGCFFLREWALEFEWAIHPAGDRHGYLHAIIMHMIFLLMTPKEERATAFKAPI